MSGCKSIPVFTFVILSLGAMIPAHSQDIHDGVLLENDAETPNISTRELREILEKRSAVVVDVRTYDEFALSHIPGALNVTGKAGSTRGVFTSDATEIGRIVEGDKAAPIVIYCAGPYCGKAKRVASDLAALGHTNVRRYQLGIPVWRALGGVTQIEASGVHTIISADQTAVFIDVRDEEHFKSGSLPNAKNIQARYVESGSGGREIANAKEDGRLPMEDHNTRVIVFGDDASKARHVAEAIARNAFHNVSFFGGSYTDLTAGN